MSEELLTKFNEKMCLPFAPNSRMLQSGPVILGIELSLMPKRVKMTSDYLGDEVLPALQKSLDDDFIMTNDHVKLYCR
jgi:hypothetical protein